MKTILAIPSGQRTVKLINCILAWRKVCGFEIAVYTWDEETEKNVSCITDHLFKGELASFAVNHNFMASAIKEWDVYICGADDLYPGFGINHIERVCRDNPGKIVWAKDGFLNQQPTHAIITRQWYDNHGYIFDEKFKHNFCDTDLFIRAATAGEVVKCFKIGFDHRHYLKTEKKKDEIYKLGESTYAEDKKYFEAKHKGEIINVNEIPEVRIEDGDMVPAK